MIASPCAKHWYGARIQALALWSTSCTLQTTTSALHTHWQNCCFGTAVKDTFLKHCYCQVICSVRLPQRRFLTCTRHFDHSGRVCLPQIKLCLRTDAQPYSQPARALVESILRSA